LVTYKKSAIVVQDSLKSHEVSQNLAHSKSCAIKRLLFQGTDGSFAIPRDFHNGTNFGRLLEGKPSAPECIDLLPKAIGMTNFPINSLSWKSRETDGICRRADRRAFDGGVSMFQMPSRARAFQNYEPGQPLSLACWPGFFLAWLGPASGLRPEPAHHYIKPP